MNRLDTIIGYFAPRWAADRLAARATMTQIESFTGGQSGYDAGKLNRLTSTTRRNDLNENAIPRAQIDQLRSRSWDLYRNNPHARKILRTLEAKVIGRGLCPQSQAEHADGTANVEFRARAQQLWQDIGGQLDYRGRPGRGGQHHSDQQRMALRGAVLGGETLYRLIPRSSSEQLEMGLAIPFQLQLIAGARLVNAMPSQSDGALPGNRVLYGIELAPDDRRVAYWILDRHPSEPGQLSGSGIRVSANQIGHLYVSDDVDQLRGVPWFAPALLTMRDTQDYQYNELKASAVGSCVALGVRRPTGANQFGLSTDGSWELADAEGNRHTFVQPGMIIDLGSNGSLEAFNPQRPHTSAEAWIQHMTRSTAAALPGVKTSTLIGDYRGSSFSSERSADNDAWPEISCVQDWFAFGFCQPIFEAVIQAAMLQGYFDGMMSRTDRKLDVAHWQGPVALSINPKDDANAASLRIANATSTPQEENAKVGGDWRRRINDIGEFIAYAQSKGLPQNLIDQYVGIAPSIQVAEIDADSAETIADTDAQKQTENANA